MINISDKRDDLAKHCPQVCIAIKTKESIMSIRNGYTNLVWLLEALQVFEFGFKGV